MWNLRDHANGHLSTIKERWEELHHAPTIFAYDLKVMEERYLPGPWEFYLELNPQRSGLRRPPQAIQSLNQPFCEDKFNFKKVDPLEHLTDIQFHNTEINIIVNKSPLTRYHSLICPELAAGHNQRMTKAALHFSVEFIRNINDPAFRIGYNSPGALASLNHLHMHLIYMDRELYIDRARLEPLAGTFIYRLHTDMPTEAICMIIYKTDSDDELLKKLHEAYGFIQWLCNSQHPHNLFITQDRTGAGDGATKLFIFARKDFSMTKNLQGCNIGFCELAGYFTVGNKELFDNLNEDFVLEKIRNETGPIFQRIYQYFQTTITSH